MKTETVKKRDIVLFALDLYLSKGQGINEKELCQCLKIKKGSLNRYLRYLKENEIISVRDKILFVTDKGKQTIDFVNRTISHEILEPETSGFLRKVPLNLVMDQLKHHSERIEFLNRYYIRKERDASIILDDIRSMREGSRLSRYINEVLSIEGDSNIDSFEDFLKTSSIIGMDEGTTTEETEGSTVDRMILKAEVLRRRGSIKESRDIYDGLLRRRAGLTPSQWLLCISGSILCLVYLNQEEKGLELINDLIPKIKDRMERGYLEKIKADIIQDMDRFEDASVLYRSCLGVFQENEFPLIRLTILNNLGVQYCRKKNMKIAADFWEEALKISKKVSLPYVEAIISLNLVDAYAQKKRFYKAEELLRNAAKVLRSVGDLEGLSGVDFNKSLVFIEKGEKKKALKYFEKSMRFHLTYKRKREERRRVFEGRMRAKGLL